MSAWVVSKEHIDLLVRAALVRQIGDGHVYLRQLEEDEAAPESPSYHVSQPYPESKRILYFDVNAQTADALGRLLWWECVRSVAYRYQDCTVDKLPGYGHTLAEYEGYTFPAGKMLQVPTNPVTVLKQIACYEYQSCEHPDWQTNDAKRICDWLRLKTISRLPGYEEAPWGVDPVRA